MRKSFVKLLTLAPVALVALTACEAKLSEDKAKERAEGYDPAVVENYESVTIKTSYSKKEAKGSIFEMMIEFLEDDEYEEDPELCFFTLDLVDEAAAEIGDEGELTTTYYSYKKTGLKVVINGNVKKEKTDDEPYSMEMKTSSTIYVLDDGRIEKQEMSISGKSEGSMEVFGQTFDFSGSIDVKGTQTFTWNAK